MHIKYWLITYQQRSYGERDWIVANCATSLSPARWLLGAVAEYPDIATVLLFAVATTTDECQLIHKNI